MKSYLFVNPLSGHYSGGSFQTVMERLGTVDIIPEVFKVTKPAEIYECCHKINKESLNPLVIVAGGDGTFNAVVNGIEPGGTTLAVLPFGTSNVLAAEIGIKSVDDALERIIKGKTDSLSVGVIEFEDKALRFVLMAGVGLDGEVVRDVLPLAKRFLRQGAYALSALKSTMFWDRTFFEITTDATITCHTAIICNAARYGGDFILTPESSMFKPGFSLVCITGNRRRNYFKAALDLFSNFAGDNLNVLRLRSSSLKISGKRPIQIDGDFVGYGPATVAELVDFAKIII